MVDVTSDERNNVYFTPIVESLQAACTPNNQTPKNDKEAVDSDENYATTGYIVSKDEKNIWVIPEIKKEEIMGKSQEALDDLLKEKYENKGFNFNLSDINEQTISSIHVGQKVVVTYDMIGLSAPASASAIKIKIIEEK